MNTIIIRDGNGQLKYAATAKGNGDLATPYHLQTPAPIDYPPAGAQVINVTTTNTALLAANPNRRSALIQNRSTTIGIDFFISSGSVFGNGFYLAPGDTYQIDATNLHCDAITATAASGAANVVVIEGI